MTYKDDFTFIKELKAGDEDAYKYLMHSYYEKLCHYAFQLIKDHDEAEDIVQETFVRIWINAKHLKPDKSLSAFLYRCVYNEFIDRIRKQKKIVPLEQNHLETITQVFVETASVNPEEILDQLKDEIQKLPPKCKEVFLLKKKEGLSLSEISNYLKISKKTAEGHITRAYKILRKRMLQKGIILWLTIVPKFSKNTFLSKA